MKRMAQEYASLLGPLQELQARFRLEIPDSYIKEENIRESADQSLASYVIIWYDVENLEEDREQVDIEPVIEDLASQVLGDLDWLNYSMGTNRTARHTFQTAIQVKYEEGVTKKASAKRRIAQDIVPPEIYPVSAYVGEDVYGIEELQSGGSYRITENGIALEEDFPSAPLALGSLIGVLIEKIKEIEAGVGRDSALQVDEDFLLGLSAYIMDNSQISEDAKSHFVTFVELVTNMDLEAQLAAE